MEDMVQDFCGNTVNQDYEGFYETMKAVLVGFLSPFNTLPDYLVLNTIPLVDYT